MSEGELLQIEKARKLNITEDIYFDIIRQKTASLIAACCESGAHSVGVDAETAEKMRRFGELVGMAFQIKDDLFDYGSGMKIGKPTGIDIKERKMTLPLIYSLNQMPNKEKNRVIRIFKRHNENPKKVKEVIDLVFEYGGIEYATEKMHVFIKESIEILHSFPESEARSSLEKLLKYTTEREK